MMMRRLWTAKSWLLFESCLLVCIVSARKESVQQKADAYTPVTTLSPPEGNTTFLDGTTWCIARPSATKGDLQNALDWACGPGKTDCNPIRAGGICFHPDNLLSHASYAFNSYYQQNGNSDIACNFGGTATLANTDPSYGECKYAASGLTSSANTLIPYGENFIWMLSSCWLLWYLGS
ncbi:hypothetical protein Droror1_Dr00018383 [Drosera rotundifolia]